MIIIQDRVYVDILIDGKPLGGPNLVASIALLEGAPVIAPSMVMVLNDHGGMLSKDLVLTDGNEILVTIGKSPEDLKTVSRQYRVFNVRQLHGQAGPMLQVLGVYDAVKYTTESARDSYTGTSEQVLKLVADKCSLEYDGPQAFNGRSTDDNQIWMNVAKSRGSFVQHFVAKHAYMDQYSAMYAALTSLGVLRYRNIMDVVATPVDKIKYVFALNIMPGDEEFAGKEVYMVNKTKEFSQAGTVNTTLNYGSTMICDGQSGVTRIEDKVDVKTGAPFLAINDQIAQTIDRAQIEYAPIDSGNTHENFYRAVYQNKKQLGLFSERLSLIVQDPTEVQLLDPVIYKQADADPNKPVRNTDIYIVIGKTVFVVGGQNYGERIELARMSITEQGEAELKASEPTIARESSVPEVTIDPSATVAANSLDRARSAVRTLGPMENMSKLASASAGKVLNNVKLIQPSIARLSNNMKSYLEKPAQAAKDIRAAANSAKQMRDTAREMRNNVRNMSQALKEGNFILAASGLSTIAQSASYFRPDGIMGNLSSMLGVTQVMQTTAEIYNSVSNQLQAIRAPLDAIEGIGSELDGVVNNMRDVASSYTDIVGDLAGGYNSAMEAVTGQSRMLNIPNLEINRTSFHGLIQSSITPITAPIQQVSYQVQTVADVQSSIAKTLTVKDDTRNYAWLPETGYRVVTVAANDLAARVQTLSDHIENADRQFEDFEYERSKRV